MKWLIILLILINNLFACELKEVSFKNKKYQICEDISKKNQFYYSQKCKEISNCFDLALVNKINNYPNQSPLFTLCYDLKGVPGFAIIPGKKEKLEVCLKQNKLVGLEYLMYSFQSSALKK